VKGKITKRTVDATLPGERDLFLWDVDLKGFGLKVSPAGSKVYLVQYRLGGREARTQRYTIGKHASPWTPDKAREEAERLLGRVANEVDPTKERKAKLAAHRADAGAPTLPNLRPDTSTSTPNLTRNPAPSRKTSATFACISSRRLAS
jgi:Arm DNA-binding domain